MPVNIRGKEYRTVAERLALLHTDHAGKVSIETRIVASTPATETTGAEVIVEAKITISDNGTERVFVDMAHEREERVNKRAVNFTSYLENASTSAVGRALAAAGYAGSEYASADELAGALQDAGQGQQNMDTIKELRKTREELKEARETETVLKKDLGNALKKLDEMKGDDDLPNADLQRILKAHSESDDRLAALFVRGRELVGKERFDNVLALINGDGKLTQKKAYQILDVCYALQ